MVMQEQAKRLSQPLHWGRREKTVMAAFSALVAAAAIVLLVFALSSGAPARADCVEVTFPSTLGGASAHGCGAKARQICASGAFKGTDDQLRAACEHAGFPFRPSS